MEVGKTVDVEDERQELRRLARTTAEKHANPHHLPQAQAVNVCDITYIEGSVEKAITYLAEVLSTSLKKVLQEQLLEHDVSTSLWKPRAVYLVVCRDVRHSARKIVRELFGHQHII